MALLIILLLVSLIVKRFWIAGIIVTLLVMLLNLPEIEYWFDLFGIAAILGLVVFSLVRLGLLSATVIFGVSGAVNELVITSDLTHWWATGTIVTLGEILALAFYGFYVALAGRPMIGSEWLEG